MKTYDLVVIGSGPGGQKAAIQAAKLGKEVCVIEKMDVVGGVAINTGTIPSKALREAVVDHLSARKALAETRNAGYLAFDRAETLAELMGSCQRVIRAEIDIVRQQFSSNSIDLRRGWGSIAGEGVVSVRTADENTESVRARNILVAVGTSPARPSNIPFDNSQIFTSDDILHIQKLPSTMLVVGGGVIGTEYASMLGALGVRVTLIEGRPRLLEFLDSEICEALQYHLRQAGVTLRLGEKVISIRKVASAPDEARGAGTELVEAVLESGKTLRAECLMYCIGRQGATERLGLETLGVKADERGRIKVNEHFQAVIPGPEKGQPARAVPGLYAVGDVIGFPALASTSMEQGRVAACHMFGEQASSIPDLFPYGIYSVPEISMVGWTEERLTAAGVPYESGIAQYKETARGHLLGDEIGMLKMLVHQESRVVLGVHCLGTGATELIHIGQAVMAFQGTVEYFINAVFNYPTLAECYKVAAFNALNKLKSR